MFRTRKDTDAQPNPASREVNNLLHTLRGEQFRHTQNVRRSRAHLAALASRTYNDPSLPFSDIYKFAHSAVGEHTEDQDPPRPALPVILDGVLQYDYPRGAVPGPPIPTSWGNLFRHDPRRDRNTTNFRREALALVFSHTSWSFGSSDVPRLVLRTSQGIVETYATPPSIPPLTQICLRVILGLVPDAESFREDLLPLLPPHFYRDVLRYTAVHDPLPDAKLYALYEQESHVDGELIVVGPQATVQRDVLVNFSLTSTSHREGGDEETEDRGEGPSSQYISDAASRQTGEAHSDDEDEQRDGDSWEAASSSSRDFPPPLHTLVVLNAPVSAQKLFLFPVTLTCLALLALPDQSPVHRLPQICPLLEVLDLSYNPWLNDPPGGKGVANTESVLDRIEWGKWARLRILGLRGCNVPGSVVARVNRGRSLEDVEVIGVVDPVPSMSMSVVEGMMESLRLSD